jgi:hypothetical protein
MKIAVGKSMGSEQSFSVYHPRWKDSQFSETTHASNPRSIIDTFYGVSFRQEYFREFIGHRSQILRFALQGAAPSGQTFSNKNQLSLDTTSSPFIG